VALINPDVKNERVFAFAEPYNRRDFVNIIKEARPNFQPPPEHIGDDRDLSEVAEWPRSVELLKWFGKDGFTGLKESVLDTIDAADAYDSTS
jgi:hypothetical protein